MPEHRQRRLIVFALAACVALVVAALAAFLRSQMGSAAQDRVDAPRRSRGTASGVEDGRAARARVDQVKPVMRGLLDNKGAPPPGVRDRVDGFVVHVPWRELQPEGPSPIRRPNAIDEAIAASSAGGDLAGLQLRLRVLAGVDAPDWAKALDGGPVEVADDGRRSTVGVFWGKAFGAAYDDLMSQLAAAYDDEPLLRDVVVARCTTFHPEPMLRQWGDEATQAALLKAGYSFPADLRCQREQLASHQVWKATRSVLSANPYQLVTHDGRVVEDLVVTKRLIEACRRVLGHRCVLANNSLRWPVQSASYGQLYADLRDAGPPLTLQTAAPERIGDWAAALRFGAELGASSIELNRSYPAYDEQALLEVGRRLAASA